MKNLILLLLVSISTAQKAIAFSTSQGTYLSQQDLMIALNEIFLNAHVINSELEGCTAYNYDDNRRATNYYELGFINLENGQALVKEPDSSYVLHLDTCITKIIQKGLYSYNVQFVDKILSTSATNALNLFRHSMLSNTESETYTTTSNNQILRSDLFVALSEDFLKLVRAKDMPLDLRNQTIESIFLSVFGTQSLIPVDYMTSKKAEIISESEKPTFSIYQFILLTYKKAIINDFFLKY